MRLRTFVFFVVLHSTAATLGAQARANAYVDFTIGANLSIGNLPNDGEYYERGPTFVLLAFGNQPDANRPLIAALHLGLNVVMGGPAQCHPTPLGGCRQDFPFGPLIATTVGGRLLRPPWSLVEVTAGPALVGVNPSGMSFGVLGVGRIGVPPGRYLSPGLAFHLLAAPIHGDFALATGLGFSLRTW